MVSAGSSAGRAAAGGKRLVRIRRRVGRRRGVKG